MPRRRVSFLIVRVLGGTEAEIGRNKIEDRVYWRTRLTQSLRSDHRKLCKLTSNRISGCRETRLSVFDPIDDFEAAFVRKEVTVTQRFVILDFDACESNHILAIAGASRNQFLSVAKRIGQGGIRLSIVR